MARNYGDLQGALARLEQELPGWWWSAGWCPVSADATIAPFGDSPDVYLCYLVDEDRFNDGFMHDEAESEDVASSLHAVIDEALAVKAALTPEQHRQAKEAYDSRF